MFKYFVLILFFLLVIDLSRAGSDGQFGHSFAPMDSIEAPNSTIEKMRFFFDESGAADLAKLAELANGDLIPLGDLDSSEEED